MQEQNVYQQVKSKFIVNLKQSGTDRVKEICFCP